MPPFYTPKRLADYLKLSVRTLRRWRQFGYGPKFTKIGREVRYYVSDVNRYIESCRVETNTQRR